MLKINGMGCPRLAAHSLKPASAETVTNCLLGWLKEGNKSALAQRTTVNDVSLKNRNFVLFLMPSTYNVKYMSLSIKHDRTGANEGARHCLHQQTDQRVPVPSVS